MHANFIDKWMVLQVCQACVHGAFWREIQATRELQVRFLPKCLQCIFNGAIDLVLELYFDASDFDAVIAELKMNKISGKFEGTLM